MTPPRATWDGLPVAREPPYASAVVVWRNGPDGREFLVLHRLHAGGVDHEGDWAWTTPAGARRPGESPEEAARRELFEETGLDLPLESVHAGLSDEVALFVARAPSDAVVVLDAEHDRCAWVTLDEAVRRCLPPRVGDGIARVAARLA